MSIQDGGPAFPVADYDHMVFQPETVAETKRDLSGMSLRDYFAAKAMQTVISNRVSLDRMHLAAMNVGAEQEELIARAAYYMADAMLAARSA